MASRNSLFLIVTAILAITILSVLFFEVLQLKSNPTIIEKDTLFQISCFNTFYAGNFEGNTAYAELRKHGDFGIGTLNGLDGEMIALDGVFFHIPVSGIVRQIDASEITPYATVAFFKKDQTLQIAEASNYSQLTENINSSLPSHDVIYAIKVHGFFDSVKTRSVPIQTKPYPTVGEVVKNQTVFNLDDVKGTAVGFYFPNSMDGVDFAGYHLHFLTDDHLQGGHLLECSVKNATIEIDQINNYRLQIP